MSSAKMGTDPLTFAIATAVNTVASTSCIGESAPAAPQIHVHHFHHQSCLHHPEVLCAPLYPGAPVTARSEDDYAVVFNSTNVVRSPRRPTLQPVCNKLSTFIVSSPQKAICTATIRHPSLASLVFHQPRNTLIQEPISPSSSFFNKATGTSPAFVSRTPSPRIGSWAQPSASLHVPSTTGLQTNPYTPNVTNQSASQITTSSCVPVSLAPERAATLGPNDPSIYYRLAGTGYNLRTAKINHPSDCHSIAGPTSPINLTDRLLRWFRSGEATGGRGRDTSMENLHAQRRRSKSQPPQNQRQRVQLVQIYPRPARHQRPNVLMPPPSGSYPAGSNRRRQLPPAPCTCSHHRQPQLYQTSNQNSFASMDHQHRSRLPRWLFPCGPHQKHSLSPPSNRPPCVAPPPPPPRCTAVESKPVTRNVEVQTQMDVIPPCCSDSVGIESALCGMDNITECCSGEHKQHILLHHYHFHHFYHCETQQPVLTTGATATNFTTSTTVAATESLNSRPSSPLIKLSVNWPPNAAISIEDREENINEDCRSLVTEEFRVDETCTTPDQTTDGDPPAPVSDALRAIQSAKVETPTGQQASFKVEEMDRKNEESLTQVSLKAQTHIMDFNQTDHRSIFLQNINQLKRTGWYWGPLTIEEAELLLKDRPNGSFLVRDSGHELYILSVSFRAENRTYHTRIEHTGGKFGFAVQGDADTTSPSIAQFINHVIAESERGRTRFFLRQSALTTLSNQRVGSGTIDQLEDENHHVEARLLYPVSRFLVVHSLAHLCRFEILLKVRKDHIDLLPLPERLKKYLHERQYYTEFVQAYLESVGHLLPSNMTATTTTSTFVPEVVIEDEEDEIEDHV